MKKIVLGAALLLAACSDAAVDEAANDVDANSVDAMAASTETMVDTAVADVVEAVSSEQDISTLPAGRYTDEDGHAYIAFSYDHQGYSYPILRFNGDAFEADMMLDPETPTNSTLSVDIDPSMIDSGVARFNEHLVSGDMFDVKTHPGISFATTSLSMDSPTTGVLLGDLTMKGVTNPLALDVTLNKVGEHFRNGNPMFGVSARGKLMRSEWDLGYAAPNVGDEVDLMIEVEFQKAEEG